MIWFNIIIKKRIWQKTQLITSSKDINQLKKSISIIKEYFHVKIYQMYIFLIKNRPNLIILHLLVNMQLPNKKLINLEI